MNKVQTAQRQRITEDLEKLTNVIEQRKDQKMETERKKGRSASYSLKAWSDHVKGLNELGLITDEEIETIKTIHANAMNKYVKQSMGGW